MKTTGTKLAKVFLLAVMVAVMGVSVIAPKTTTAAATSTKKVSKAKFVKYIKANPGVKDECDGKKYIYGTACKITIKSGKVTKIAQMYQA